MSKYFITGATGPLGKGTVEFLLQKGVNAADISILSRDTHKSADLKEKGVKIVQGNYDDYASLLAAFKGVEKLVFVSGNDVVNRIPQHENVIKAAKEAGVQHVVYTSSERSDETDASPIAIITAAHVKTEEWLKDSGMKYTFLKNTLYMDLVPYILGKVMETKSIYYPAGEGKAAFVLRAEMAEATANILLGEGHEGKSYSIRNTENYSFQDVADVVTEITGDEIMYISPSPEEYTATLAGAGVPESHSNIFLGMALAQEKDEFATTSNDLEMLLGRKPTSVKEYLSAVYSNQ